MRQHRPIGPRFGPPGIHGQGLVEQLGCGFVVLRVNRVIGQQQQGRHVAGIVTQGGLERFKHQRTGAGRIGPCQPKVNIGILGKLFQRVAKYLRRQPIILLVQGQFAAGQPGLAQIRVGLFGLVEKILQHQLGLGAQAERGLAQRDQVGGIAIEPSA